MSRANCLFLLWCCHYFSLYTSRADISYAPFSGAQKLDALLMELKQAKEVVSRTQAAM
jgi:hypothetical protein